MKPALDLVYRDLDASSALNEVILKKLEKLNRFTDQIIHSRVVLDSPHNHKNKGKQFRACVELQLKGQPVAITQDADSIHVAVRDAFNSAERKIKEIVAKKRVTH